MPALFVLMRDRGCTVSTVSNKIMRAPRLPARNMPTSYPLLFCRPRRLQTWKHLANTPSTLLLYVRQNRFALAHKYSNVSSRELRRSTVPILQTWRCHLRTCPFTRYISIHDSKTSSFIAILACTLKYRINPNSTCIFLQQ